MAKKEEKEKKPKASLEEINNKLDKLVNAQRGEMIWRWIRRIIWIVVIVAVVYYGYNFAIDLKESFDINSIEDIKKAVDDLISKFSGELSDKTNEALAPTETPTP